MGDPVIGDSEYPGITENSLGRTLSGRVPFVSSLNILAKKKHDIRNTFKETVRNVLSPNGTGLDVPFILAIETVTPSYLLLEIDGDTIHHGAHVETDAFLAVLVKLEVTGEKNGPQLVHNFNAIAS